MKPDLNLSIPRRCHEKWESFTPQPNGGFCSSCSKTVVDFTKMTDKQILTYFTDKPAHTCGRFRQDQLKSYFHNVDVVRINPGFTLFKAGVMSLLVMLISKQSMAMNSTPAFQMENVQNFQYTITESKTTPGKFYISGTVTDESGLPFPGVNVVLKGTTIGTATNIDGHFAISHEVSEGDVLVFSMVGYTTQEFKIKHDTPAIITMAMDDVEWMGEVAYDGVYDSKPESKNLWSRLKNLF